MGCREGEGWVRAWWGHGAGRCRGGILLLRASRSPLPSSGLPRGFPWVWGCPEAAVTCLVSPSFWTQQLVDTPRASRSQAPGALQDRLACFKLPTIRNPDVVLQQRAFSPLPLCPGRVSSTCHHSAASQPQLAVGGTHRRAARRCAGSTASSSSVSGRKKKAGGITLRTRGPGWVPPCGAGG